MNNHIKRFFMYMFLAIFLMIPCVVAYDINNLKSYYGFESTNLTKLIDNVNVNNLTSTSYPQYTSVTGKVGNGLKAGALINTTAFTTNLTYNLDTSNKYSINIWMKNSTNTGTAIYYRIGNTTNTHSFLESGSRIVYTNTTTTTPIILAVTTENIDWDMFTITYDGTYCFLYINTILVNTSACKNLFANSNKFSLSGYGSYGSFDELSIWNDTLTLYDIYTLYNNNQSLNYNDTILYESGLNLNMTPMCDGDYYFTQYIDVMYLDSNGLPTFYGREYYLNGDYGYCPNGCTNGVCNTNLSCTAENTLNYCNYIGQTQCLGSTQYQTCSIGNNNCPSWSLTTSCLVNEYCVNIKDEQNFNQASCGNTNLSAGQSSNLNFMVTPYSMNRYEASNGSLTTIPTTKLHTSYKLNTVTRTLNVNTKSLIHIQEFAFGSLPYTSFASIVCDYKENSILEIITPENINETLVKDYDVQTSNHIYDFNISIDSMSGNISNMSILIYDTFDNELLSFIITRDKVAKQLCIYDYLQSTTLFCDTSSNTYDDLININVKIYIDIASSTYTVTLIPYRVSGNIRYNSIVKAYSSGLESFDKISFDSISDSNNTLEYLNIKYVTAFNGFTQTEYNSYDFLTCTYGTIGCRIARTYLNLDGMPDTTNYQDWNICINELNGVGQVLENNNLGGSELSQTQKIFLALITMVVLIILGTVIGFSVHNATAGFVVGVVLASFSLIGFIVVGWITEWILIVLILVAIATMILVSYVHSGNTGGTG